VVIGNLNKPYDELDHPEEARSAYRGGLSGRPCFARSTDLVRRTRDAYGRGLTIIGCGGILSAGDAMEKFSAGADLVQLTSGMIFKGPHVMKEIAGRYAQQRPLPARKSGSVPAPRRMQPGHGAARLRVVRRRP
jgi:dihydroorotate dehydrogenase